MNIVTPFQFDSQLEYDCGFFLLFRKSITKNSRESGRFVVYDVTDKCHVKVVDY